MAIYYLDPAASGANDGTSWADAWETLADAIAGTGPQPPPTAGDIVYMRGTETLAADVTITNAGSNVDYCKWIGCNASGVVDGTRYVVDASGGAYNVKADGTADYGWLENIEVQGGSAHGIQIAAGSIRWVLINCISHGCTGKRGISVAGSAVLWRCAGYDNGEDGIYLAGDYSKAYYCRASGNAQYGFYGAAEGVMFIKGASYENTGDGVYLDNRSHAVEVCSDGNGGAGFNVIDAGSTVVAARGTNNVNGLLVSVNQKALLGIFYAGGNSGTEIDSDYEELLLQGALSAITSEGGDADQGYVDTATDDYNLDPDEATYFSQAVELP